MEDLTQFIGFSSGVIGIATGVAALITILIPSIPSKLKRKIVLYILVAGLLFSFFSSNPYKHWHYFDLKKIYVISGQQPHSMKANNQLFHNYILTLENNYTEGIKAENVTLRLNSPMPILKYEILLSDIREDSFNVNIQNLSELQITIDNISGGQVFAISYECSSRAKNNMHENLKFELSSTQKMLEYDLFGRHHSCDCSRGINAVLSTKIYNRKDILFEKVVAIDHRKVPHNFKFEYQYGQYVFDNKKRAISIFYSTDRHLNLVYDGIRGILKYKSIEPINEKISILRMISFNNDFFLHESTLPLKRVNN